jgi:tetratricopeptide (TPR) repeat protein
VIELLLEAERAMDVGLTDQAERLFRQAADADPRNSIAVVGLARVALERGDEAGALGLARRALEIDADNPAARRLVDRLVEVMAYRGGASGAADIAGAADPPGAGDVSGAADVSGAGDVSGAADVSGAPDASGAADVSGAPDPPEVTEPERRGLLRRILRR